MASYTALIDGKAGAYGVYFPDLPGCTAMGATLEEAIVNAAEAMRDRVDVAVEKGGAIPEPRWNNCWRTKRFLTKSVKARFLGACRW